MKIGITAIQPAGDTLLRLRRDAELLEDLGLDLVWIDDGWDAPFVAASALAALTSTLRVAVVSDLGDAHPIYVAEEAATVDQSLNGRLVLGLRPAAGVSLFQFAEAVDIVLAASAPRPFRYAGDNWTVPGGIAENTFNVEDRVRVSPGPAQLELPTWLVGAATVDIAAKRGLSVASDQDENPETVWHTFSSWSPATAQRLRRPWRVPAPLLPGGQLDSEALVDTLRDAQHRWGLDVALIDIAQTISEPERARCLRTIAQRVRPRLQLDRLPPGLEDHWKNTLPTQ